jgi:hypothetical protein
LVWRYLGEFTALNGSLQLSFYMIALFAGISAAGAIRGAQILMGPVTVLFLGTTLFALPEGVRRARLAPNAVTKFSRALSGCLGALALAWAAVVLIATERMGGARLLGASSPGAQQALPGVALMVIATGLSFGAFIGLRALAAAHRSLNLRVAIAPLTVALGSIGAIIGDSVGAALGLAVAAWLGVLLWWWQLRAETRSKSHPTDSRYEQSAASLE